ncbi:threonine/serine dehydratase [Fulvivirga sp. RKSG066]|uniref:threonine ammonia-lyase n=1 Tax=Fulvivirga aurantia TaxID=2529383 RepID=UPI0012BD42E2|nr:threonine/serine dehydratase [Fulvivirga aurantia]MTI19550.1 threonine/serine dehydratase [Fulvivirga aurantia]
MVPTLQTLREAHDRIRPYIHNTPVLTSTYINSLSEASIYFKCENFQRIGAFKARGGFNALLSLGKDRLTQGVTAHSSGNHAQAVAVAAQTLGVPAYIVMPKTAPKVKQAAVAGYGAEIILCEPTLEARESTVAQIVEEKGAILIHPFNDYSIIAGQGTAAIELLEEVYQLDYILTPIGGGGLTAGSSLAAKYLSPTTKIVGCEPEKADDAYRSLRSGELKAHKSPPKTTADGLLTTLGDKTFGIIKDNVGDILLVNESEIIQAMRLIWERMKIIIEPSCAVPFAALLRNKDLFKGKKVGIILSGGNVDLGKLPFE